MPLRQGVHAFSTGRSDRLSTDISKITRGPDRRTVCVTTMSCWPPWRDRRLRHVSVTDVWSAARRSRGGSWSPLAATLLRRSCSGRSRRKPVPSSGRPRTSHPVEREVRPAMAPDVLSRRTLTHSFSSHRAWSPVTTHLLQVRASFAKGRFPNRTRGALRRRASRLHPRAAPRRVRTRAARRPGASPPAGSVARTRRPGRRARAPAPRPWGHRGQGRPAGRR